MTSTTNVHPTYPVNSFRKAPYFFYEFADMLCTVTNSDALVLTVQIKLL